LLAERLTDENRALAERVTALTLESQDSEHFIDTLMDNVPANIYFKDRESRFVRVNQSQANWLGHGHPQDLSGKTDYDFFDEAHSDQATEDERRIMVSGKPIVGYVERETLPNGEEAWVLTTKMPFRDREGNIIGTFGISNDVSELVRAQQTLERERNILRALIDSFPDHIYIKDSGGQFMVVNKAFASFVGEA
jgi:PAS domain S-box-containing protein